MKVNESHYIAESGPVLDACEKYRKDYAAWRSLAQTALGKIPGASCFRINWDGYVCAVQFEGPAPEGFKKPDRDGSREPYKKSEWLSQLKEIGPSPLPDDYLKDLIKCPSWIEYAEANNPKHYGGFHIGGYSSSYQICWYSMTGPLLVVMPDLALELKRFPQMHPGCVITCGADKWVLPDGLKPMMIEEWDYLAAKHAKEAA